MTFLATIPFHTYNKYFDTRFRNLNGFINKNPINIVVKFIVVDDFEKMRLTWHCNMLDSWGEFDEDECENDIGGKVYEWIRWKGRKNFTKKDYI